MSEDIRRRKKVVLFGLPMVTLGVILHAYQLVVAVRNMRDAAPFEPDLYPPQLHFVLLLSLLLAAVGLAIGRRWGLVASSLGLLVVLLGYIDWFKVSHRNFQLLTIRPYSEHPELIPPSLFGFIGARWWDLVLLILFVVLLVWEIKVLVNAHSTKRTVRSDAR
jgi:hypothetical protein